MAWRPLAYDTARPVCGAGAAAGHVNGLVVFAISGAGLTASTPFVGTGYRETGSLDEWELRDAENRLLRTAKAAGRVPAKRPTALLERLPVPSTERVSQMDSPLRLARLSMGRYR